MFVVIASLFTLGILYVYGKITQTHIIIGVFVSIIFAALILVGKNLVKWFEHRRELRKSVTPVRAAILLKKFYLDVFGQHVDVELKRTVFPKLKSGRDKIARMIVRPKLTGETISVKVPLDRGEVAILNGDLNFDKDLDIIYDQKEDKMFSPEHESDSLMEQLQELDPEVAKTVFTQQVLPGLQPPSLQQVVPESKTEKGEENE